MPAIVPPIAPAPTTAMRIFAPAFSPDLKPGRAYNGTPHRAMAALPAPRRSLYVIHDSALAADPLISPSRIEVRR